MTSGGDDANEGLPDDTDRFFEVQEELAANGYPNRAYMVLSDFVDTASRSQPNTDDPLYPQLVMAQALLAEAALACGWLDLAILHHDTAAETASHAGDLEELRAVSMLRAEIFRKLKDEQHPIDTSLLDSLRQFAQQMRELEYYESAAITYLNLGIIAGLDGNLEARFRYLTQAATLLSLGDTNWYTRLETHEALLAANIEHNPTIAEEHLSVCISILNDNDPGNESKSGRAIVQLLALDLYTRLGRGKDTGLASIKLRKLTRPMSADAVRGLELERALLTGIR